MNVVDSQSTQPNQFPQTVKVRTHTFSADAGVSSGGVDSAPGPHDYFNSALATCKAITALWYAKKNGIPLERVESHVEADDSQERAGVYRLSVRLKFLGPLSQEQRERLARAVANCPIHKLMTTADVQIETVEAG